MFFIEHGSVNIRLPTGEVVNTLRDGSHFGGKYSSNDTLRIATNAYQLVLGFSGLTCLST